MRRIRSKETAPELAVRHLLHRIGCRFRKYDRRLAGTPDVVLAGRRKVIFVNGCFWHQHAAPCPRRARMPRSNLAYWKPKLTRNVRRDAENTAQLEADGWDVIVVWECETSNVRELELRLRRLFMKKTQAKSRKPPGPAPEVLKIEGDWKDAMKKLISKKRPEGGWPKLEKTKAK
jgi:DNA mismatch endonuclease (patch repair protein)